MIFEHSSPNFDARTEQGAIDMLVLHYTGMASAPAALARLCDSNAAVSAHYLIDEDGRTFRLVDERMRAWHAGVSHWRGHDGVNDRSIGVELVNPGHAFGYRPFPEHQMAALEELACDLVQRHAIGPANVVGHSDVAPARRQDPGELFDWPKLAAAGIGVWPGSPAQSQPDAPAALIAGDAGPAVGDLQRRLRSYGYGLACDGRFGPATESVVRAFQRHFRPQRVCGRADPETLAILDSLLALSPAA